MLAVDLALFVCLNFGHVYGLVENRLFREAGEYFPGHHFRLYHGWLALLDLANALVVLALSGYWLLAAFAAVYFPLGLDVTWWVKRWLDFHIRLYVMNLPVFLGPVASPGYYKEPNAWHTRGDWDNYGGGPLFFGVYRWWWVFGFASICLLVLSLI
jgi:hypothetical protein